MSRWFIAALALLALLVLGYTLWFRQGLEVRTTEVRRGAIREFVDEQGKTRLPEVFVITAPFEGRVAGDDGFKEGDTVSAGQVLARLAPEELDLEVAEAQAAVQRLQASIVENDDTTLERSAREQALKFVESMVSTVAAAEARKTSGRSRVEFAESQLGRTRQLATSGATAQQEQERAQLAYVESQVEYQQDVLIAEAMKALQAATDLLPRMVFEYIGRKGLTHSVLAQQKAEAEARLAQAKLRQELGTLVSPVDGVILQQRHANQQYVTAHTELFRVGQLSQLEVETEVLSEEAVRIRPGSTAEIYGATISAAAGGGVSGVVSRIFPTGFTKVSSLGVEQQRVLVIVQFAEGVAEELLAEHGLGVDFRVRVRIFTAAQEAATLVPRSALFRSPDGRWHVFVVRRGRAVAQAIELGLLNDAMAEVRAGVEPGEQVIATPESFLSEGMRVRPVPTALASDSQP